MAEESTRLGPPKKAGLYDPQFEHEACGIGFVVDIKGRKSHRIVQQAIEVLVNLDHRGACGCENNTGDGAGVLLQMPHRFLVEAAKKARIALPEAGQYACGLVFLPRNPTKRRKLEEQFGHIIQSTVRRSSGGARFPPITPRSAKPRACSEPFMRQVFIGRGPDLADDMAFERQAVRDRASAPTARSAPRRSMAPSTGMSRASRSRRWSTRAC